MGKLRSFFQRHPLLRDAILWTIPALILGAVLRALLLSYLPYAFWGPDSRSYYKFAHRLFSDGAFSMDPKRRFLYPLLVTPVTLLPGGALRWLAWFQHALGFATLLPFGYVIRKTLRCWKLWIVPLTVIYAGLPIVVWSEQELLAENVFFATFVWVFAGWAAWVGQESVERSRRLFWWFLVPFALFILTKPAGRFVWPGIFVGLAVVLAWRLLTRTHAVALLAVFAISPFVGSSKQGAWLFYTATFPLTRLDTPLHAEYKEQIKDLVTRFRNDLDIYYVVQDDVPFYFLRDPGEQKERPLWTALGNKENEKLKDKIYLDLALEGVKARPDLFLYLALERIVATANFSDFGSDRFSPGAFNESFAEYYKEAADEKSPIRLALALPKKGPIPPYEVYERKLEPAPNSWRANALRACMAAYKDRFDFFRFPKLPKEQCRFPLARPTFLFWWLVLGMILSALPQYRRTLGSWTIISVGYVFGVFLVSMVISRYFAPVAPVLLVLLAVPADVACALVARRFSNRATAAERA